MMQKINPCWQTKKLILSHILILALLGSWMWSMTHPFWDLMDYSFYRFVNGFIESSSFWQGFWAISNHNLTDWFHDIVMLGFFAVYLTRKDDKPLSKKIFEILLFACIIAFTVLFINRYLCLDVFHIRRKSPSMVYDFAVNLSQKISWIKVKGRSITSYPGDHGTTALLFTMCITHLMGKKAGCLAFLYNIYWQLPRLVTGCHWFTDVIMGSFVISSFVMNWALYTPLKEWVTDILSSPFVKAKKGSHLNP
ncbi:MAG: hypothetical protein FJZ63_00845 [Chlamydiae bacterium]|nr:hypothetical protein [Chlamydiota bacterium]